MIYSTCIYRMMIEIVCTYPILLYCSASDDSQQPDRIRSLLQDLDDIRHHKLRTNLLMKIESSVAYITLPEMSKLWLVLTYMIVM